MLYQTDGMSAAIIRDDGKKIYCMGTGGDVNGIAAIASIGQCLTEVIRYVKE